MSLVTWYQERRNGRQRARTRWIPALFAMLTVVACGEDGPAGPGGSGTPADLEAFADDLPTWSEFSPPVEESLNGEFGDPVGASVQVTIDDPEYNPDFVCTKTQYSMSTNPREVITMSGALGLLVPGKLLQGAPHRDGELRTLPISERAPVRLTISLNNLVGDAFRLVDDPSEGTLKTAVNELIQASESSDFEAGSSVSFEQATSYSFDQAALGLGLSVRSDVALPTGQRAGGPRDVGDQGLGDRSRLLVELHPLGEIGEGEAVPYDGQRREQPGHGAG